MTDSDDSSLDVRVKILLDRDGSPKKVIESSIELDAREEATFFAGDDIIRFRGRWYERLPSILIPNDGAYFHRILKYRETSEVPSCKI